MLRPSRALLLTLALLALPLAAAPARAQSDMLRWNPGAADPDDVYREQVRNEVLGMKGELLAAWERDDAGAVAGFFTRTGAYLGGSGQPAQGRRAVRAALGRELAGQGTLELTPVSFGVSGDLAYEMGTLVLVAQAPGGASEMRTGGYLMVVERQWDASWRIVSLLFSDRPPAPPAP